MTALRQQGLDVALTEGGTRRIEAGQYLVATGSAPWAPPIPELAEVGHLTSAMALDLNRLPASMIVVGGSAVGLELAQLFARRGSRVSVAEALDRLARSRNRRSAPASRRCCAIRTSLCAPA